MAATSQLDELLEFLSHEQANVRKVAVEYLLGLCAGNAGGEIRDASTGRLARVLGLLHARLSDEPEIAHLALKTLINLTAKPGNDGAEARRAAGSSPQVLVQLLQLILTPKSVLADLGCMYLSNISQDGEVVRLLVRLAPLTTITAPPVVVMPEDQVPAEDRPRVRFLRKSVEMVLAQPTALDQLVEVFIRGASTADHGQWYNENANFDFLASVFANVSQHSEGRSFYLSPVVLRYPEEKSTSNHESKKPKGEASEKSAEKPTESTEKVTIKDAASSQAPEPTTVTVLSESDPTSAMSKLLCFTSHKALIRRGGVTSTVKNATFDLRAHAAFLDAGHPNYLVHALLTPLAPADLADLLLLGESKHGDLDDAPDWLVALPPDHYVEEDPELRRILLEALLVLTSTRAGRIALRAAGAYMVIREFHQRETNVPCRLVAERVVDMLMRDEAAGGDGEDDHALTELLTNVGIAEPDREMEAIVSGALEGADIEVEYVDEQGNPMAPSTKAAGAAKVAAGNPVDSGKAPTPSKQADEADDESDDDLVIEEIV